MPREGYIIPGGKRSLLSTDNDIRGVYAEHPAAAPKYHTGNNNESVESLARMLVFVPNDGALQRYIDAIGGNSRAGEIANVLTVLRYKDAEIDYAVRKSAGLGYVDFLLTQFSEQTQEMEQVVELLSDAYIHYTFGQMAPRISLSGIVFNTRQDNWYDAFRILYQSIIRATKLATHNKILTLKVDSRLYQCTPIANTMALNAETEMSASFSMQCVVKRVTILSRQYENQKPTDMRELAPLVIPVATEEKLNDGLVLFRDQQIAETLTRRRALRALQTEQEELDRQRTLGTPFNPAANPTDIRAYSFDTYTSTPPL